MMQRVKILSIEIHIRNNQVKESRTCQKSTAAQESSDVLTRKLNQEDTTAEKSNVLKRVPLDLDLELRGMGVEKIIQPWRATWESMPPSHK